MNRVFRCPQCAMTWTVPDPGHDLPVMAACACAGYPYSAAEITVMTEITPPARITLQIIRTELA